MKYMKRISPGLLVAAVMVVGCSKPSDIKPAAKNPTDKVAEHAHGTGPNGGVVLDLGSHHAEFTVDHGKQQCAILILGDDEQTPTAVSADELVLTINETKTDDGKIVEAMTIRMLPEDAVDGRASKFVGTDPGIGNVADFEGTVSGEIDGKPAQGEFKE